MLLNISNQRFLHWKIIKFLNFYTSNRKLFRHDIFVYIQSCLTFNTYDQCRKIQSKRDYLAFLKNTIVFKGLVFVLAEELNKMLFVSHLLLL